MNPSTQAGRGAIASDEPADDPEFLRAVQEYLDMLEAGRAPDRREYVRRFPALAQPLDKCLAGLEAVHIASGARKPPKSDTAKPVDPALAKALGDFQIHREIGRGGMGIVYEATQLSLGRKVALKVLPFAATFDAKHLQRFRNEAQAAAQLHHNNIVPVFAVGCERGVHFYAMQLIEGQSLSVLIDQFRDRAGLHAKGPGNADQQVTATMAGPVQGSSIGLPEQTEPIAASAPPPTTSAFAYSETLSSQHSKSRKEYFRSVARLFAQAALGLDHAHQVGIVHRDIKPANLLVDGRDNLWITDFGLAQFRSDAHLTKTGDLVGTLRYMSPEQAAGQRAILDHRSDIYSLGATLYEMATLQPIFGEQDSIALLRQITRDDPTPPRRVDPGIPVELETIVLKSVSKSPSDRYATAQEFAADLQRFLDDQPILARRPSVVDRVRMWSRRHPAVLVTAVAFLLFCLVGMGASNWLISREQDNTQKALERVKQRGEEAERRFLQARQAVDLLIQVAEQELADKPQLQATRKKVLQTALAFYQDLIDQRGDDLGSQAELSRDQDKVRQILSDLTTLEGAQRLEFLAERSIQDDLQLSSEQRTRANEFAQNWAEQRFRFFRDQRSLPFDQRQQQFVALIRANDESLAGLLSADQLRRLRQIALQTKGLFAFEEPDVIAALRLTAAQKTKIREIHSELVDHLFDKGMEKAFDRMYDKKFDKGQPEGGKGPPRPPGEKGKGPPEGGFGASFRGREEAFHRAGVERVLVQLTPEQRTSWSDLIGAPFTGSVRAGPLFSSFPGQGPQIRRGP